ncbi:MAG: hypothetical protein HYY10_00240 [Candidatus Liptonbacteria bacterium]|nr:hypothetical protein [Candidatus Liptonbacteria bacterium]
MATVTISKKITKGEELVVLTRKEYEKFLDAAAREKEVSAADVLRWSREAKRLKRKGTLPLLRSLKDLR